MPLATINAIWIGPKMGPIHAACLRSFIRNGHKVVLHTYEAPKDTPDGVELADAEKLLPRSRMVRYSRNDFHKGSLAIFADLLRYELLKQNLGLYVDCDVYCVRPVEDQDYIFGYEDDNTINNAVLKLPADCAALNELTAIKDKTPFIPPWLSTKRQMRYRLGSLLRRSISVQNLPWGSTGPQAVTWYLTHAGLIQHAAAIDIFYPLHFGQTALLLEKGLQVRDLVSPRTCLLHLYNEKIKHIPVEDITVDTPLGEILNG